MEEIIKTQNLTKSYGKVTAVSDLSISVNKGEIYGFIGLNGAGKTTTIRMLLGMVRASSGSAFIKDTEINPGKTEIWKRIGYMVEAPSHYPNLTVRENLEITKKLRLLDTPHSIERIADKLQLTKYMDRKAKNLSQGNSQRLGLAKALIHNPELLILDEPTNALDPAGIVEIRNLLKDLSHNHGVTIFVSSHILSEIAKFSSRIGIIHEGRMVKEMNRNELDSNCKKKLLLGVGNAQNAQSLLLEKGITADLSKENYLEIDDTATIHHPESIVELLVNNGLTPYLVQTQKEDLEAYFLRTINTKEK